jgi:hypothetical protein
VRKKCIKIIHLRIKKNWQLSQAASSLGIMAEAMGASQIPS